MAETPPTPPPRKATVAPPALQSARWMQATAESRIERIAVAAIDDRPMAFDEDSPALAATLAGLRRSVAARGIVEPLLLRPRQGGRFEVIAGSRRLFVAQQLSLPSVPAIVRDIDDAAALVAMVWAITGRQRLTEAQRTELQRRLVEAGVANAEAAAMVEASQPEGRAFLVSANKAPKPQLPGVLKATSTGPHFLGSGAPIAPLLPVAAARLLTELLRDADPEQLLRGAK